MEKLTKEQLFNAFYKFNQEHENATQFSETSITGVIVFKASNWKEPYSLESRSYRVSSANKRFLYRCSGNSIYASNLDGTDQCVRLDWYNWEVDYCYLEKGGNL